MANEPPSDPGAAFRDFVTQWERNFDKFANQLMGTESYSSAMNQFQQAQLSAQRAFSEFMAQQLGTMNMPTRDDVVRLGESVRQLEMRLERMERTLDTLAAGGEKKPKKRKGPPRTKRPPEAAASAAPKAADGDTAQTN